MKQVLDKSLPALQLLFSVYSRQQSPPGVTFLLSCAACQLQMSLCPALTVLTYSWITQRRRAAKPEQPAMGMADFINFCSQAAAPSPPPTTLPAWMLGVASFQ